MELVETFEQALLELCHKNMRRHRSCSGLYACQHFRSPHLSKRLTFSLELMLLNRLRTAERTLSKHRSRMLQRRELGSSSLSLRRTEGSLHQHHMVTDNASKPCSSGRHHSFSTQMPHATSSNHTRCDATDLLFVAVACKQGQAQIQAIVQQGADLNQRHPQTHQTALATAVLAGQTENVRVLIALGGDPDICDAQGQSPLMRAAEFGDVEAAAVLMARGDADAFHICPQHRSALLNAAAIGSISILQLLVEVGGVDVDRRSRFDGQTALLEAAGAGHLRAVRFLLQAGAKVSRANLRKETALGLAISGNDRGVQGPAYSRRSTGSIGRTAASATFTALTQQVAPTSGPPAQHAALNSVATGHAGTALDLGYSRGMAEQYVTLRQLGSGGNGTVSLVRHRSTGVELACKTISKRPREDASDAKKRGYVEGICREVQVLSMLRGSLQVAELKEVFEDDDNVHLILELCRGGELAHRIGASHYSERTVASYMRSVLRTLAQCHSHHILHRDVKPGNFLLRDDSERSPLLAIDFGLAVPFEPDNLPLRDLALEGTPWYMAPEVLASQVLPASDLWSAGVMAHQLLTGRFPFDDKANPGNPAMSAIWRSVLLDNIEYDAPWWDGISDEAKSFVKALLQRDPALRPTAKDALKHPWLCGTSRERSTGKQISSSVVARIQRYAQASQFKRGVLEIIAQELLQRAENGAASLQPEVQSAHEPVIYGPDDAALQLLYEKLHLMPGSCVGEKQLLESLRAMGYNLEASEVVRLLQQVSLQGKGCLDRNAFAASQIDYRHLEKNHAELWLDLAHRAFAGLDKDHDGMLEASDIISSLRTKLEPGEVRCAVEAALREAGGGPQDKGIDFEGFLRMLRGGSMDSLALYDERMGQSYASLNSIDRLNALLASDTSNQNPSNHSVTSSDQWSRHGPSLKPASYGSRSKLYGSGLSGPGEEDLDVEPVQDVRSAAAGGRRRSGSGRGGSSDALYGSANNSMHMQQLSQSGVASLPQRPSNDTTAGGISSVTSPGLTAASISAPAWRFETPIAASVRSRALPATTAAPPAVSLPSPAAPSTVPAWRFDVVVSGNSLDRSSAPPNSRSRTRAVDISSTGSGQHMPVALSTDASVGQTRNGAGLGAATAATAPSRGVGCNNSTCIRSLGLRGGHFDRRHHGSDLYHNAVVAGAGPLRTVQE